MSENLICARGLTKTYGDFVAVDGIDFDVAKANHLVSSDLTALVNRPLCASSALPRFAHLAR